MATNGVVSVLRLYVSVAVKAHVCRSAVTNNRERPTSTQGVLGVRRARLTPIQVDSTWLTMACVIVPSLIELGCCLTRLRCVHSRLRQCRHADTTRPCSKMTVLRLLYTVPRQRFAPTRRPNSAVSSGRQSSARPSPHPRNVLDDGSMSPTRSVDPGVATILVVLAKERMRRRRLHTPSLGGTHGEHVSTKGGATRASRWPTRHFPSSTHQRRRFPHR